MKITTDYKVYYVPTTKQINQINSKIDSILFGTSEEALNLIKDIVTSIKDFEQKYGKDMLDVLADLMTLVKGEQSGSDNTEAIDSLPEVYNFLTYYKNDQVLPDVPDIQDVKETDISGLFKN